jgi:hypothetical protein
MAIEKSLQTEAPEGEDLNKEEGLEIEIVNPDAVILDDGSAEIIFMPGDEADEMMDFDANLVDKLDDTEQQILTDELIGLVESDIQSRKDWADTYVKGLDILGFKYEERTAPWEGACGVHSTVLAEAAIRFQAEAMAETFPAQGPVKVKILGKETREKEEAGERVRADMNYELTDRMVEYRPEHERMLYSLGLAGSAFKKVYFDPNLDRQCAIYIPAEDVIVPYGASNIEEAERVTHVMRKTKNDLRRLQANGFYADVDMDDPAPYQTDIEERKAEEAGFQLNGDDRYTLYEIHASLTIEGIDDEEDLAKPYVVTLERSTGQLLSIRRNYEEDDELERKRQHFVHYVYVPGFGFYGLGLIHIIGGYAKAGTSIIRQLVDAGTLSNLPGGLKSRGLRIKGDDEPIEPGEFKDVDVPSGSIRDNIMPLPYKEPSQTLLALLNQITTEGRRLGAVADMDISDMSANAPVGTTLALLERTLKPMAAVQARVHYAMKLEFRMLKEIMAENAPEEYGYEPHRGEMTARRQDYETVEVIPVSDPNSTTMAQRVVQYQTVLQMSQQAPQIYNLPQLHRQMIEVLGVKNADKLVPTKDDVKPTDPVSENMNSLTGTPIKAFLNQDHEAHIAAHQAFLKDPMVVGSLGKTPAAQAMMQALQAHIAEHVGFRYRAQLEKKLGAPLPLPNEELVPEIEVELSRLAMEAGQQVSAQNQQQAAAQQAQQKAQDPIIQLKQQEMQLKQQEVQLKAQKDQLEAQLKQAELQRKAQKDQMDNQIDQQQLEIERQELEIDAQKAGAKMAADRRADNNKLDLELMKTQVNATNQKRKE